MCADIHVSQLDDTPVPLTQEATSAEVGNVEAPKSAHELAVLDVRSNWLSLLEHGDAEPRVHKLTHRTST
jgi:hypothetical protein